VTDRIFTSPCGDDICLAQLDMGLDKKKDRKGEGIPRGSVPFLGGKDPKIFGKNYPNHAERWEMKDFPEYKKRNECQVRMIEGGRNTK